MTNKEYFDFVVYMKIKYTVTRVHRIHEGCRENIVAEFQVLTLLMDTKGEYC
jgi:hypothetical protein